MEPVNEIPVKPDTIKQFCAYGISMFDNDSDDDPSDNGNLQNDDMNNKQFDYPPIIMTEEISTQYGLHEMAKAFDESNIKIEKIKVLEIMSVIIDDKEYDISSIYKLCIREEKLIDLPEYVCKLTNLQILSLVDNGLTSLPNNIGNLTNLRILYLQSNLLTSLPDSFDKLTSLEILNIGENKFTHIPNLSNLHKLENLGISNNQLIEFPDMQGTNVKYLGLDNNQINNLPHYLVDSSIKCIDLSNPKNIELIKKFLGNGIICQKR
jgi:Leucine-rich repeat (LRR) protein